MVPPSCCGVCLTQRGVINDSLSFFGEPARSSVNNGLSPLMVSLQWAKHVVIMRYDGTIQKANIGHWMGARQGQVDKTNWPPISPDIVKIRNVL